MKILRIHISESFNSMMKMKKKMNRNNHRMNRIIQKANKKKKEKISQGKIQVIHKFLQE